MVRRLRTHIAAPPDTTGYGCAFCSAHLCLEQDVLSKYFHGKHGKAFLVDRCANVYFSPPEQKELLTGTHIVRDVFCRGCDKYLGWCYDFAHDDKERYKMHRFVLERKLIRVISHDLAYGNLAMREPATTTAAAVGAVPSRHAQAV